MAKAEKTMRVLKKALLERRYGAHRFFVGGVFVGQTGARRKILKIDKDAGMITYDVIPQRGNSRKYKPRTTSIDTFDSWARSQG